MHYSYAAVVALLVTLTAAGRQPPRPVQSLKLDPVPFDDVSELLHVLKRSGRLTLADDAPNGRLVAEFYTAGKKVEEPRTSVGYGVAIHPDPKRDIQFAVQFADLDHLRLGNGPKNHTRMLLKLRVGKDVITVSTTHDIPKSVFDYSKGAGGGPFPEASGTAAEVPLFYLVANSTSLKGSTTPKQAVENHPGAQVAIFYFRRTGGE